MVGGTKGRENMDFKDILPLTWKLIQNHCTPITNKHPLNEEKELRGAKHCPEKDCSHRPMTLTFDLDT